MKQPSNTVHVTKHGLYLAPVVAVGGFDSTRNEGTDTMHIVVDRARQGVLISTMISDGLISIEPVNAPPAGDWPEQVTIAGLNVTDPVMVMQMVEEVELDDLFIPDQPGPHTVTIWARNRDPKKADTVQSKQRPKDLEQYRVMFISEAGAAAPKDDLSQLGYLTVTEVKETPAGAERTPPPGWQPNPDFVKAAGHSAEDANGNLAPPDVIDLPQGGCSP